LPVADVAAAGDQAVVSLPPALVDGGQPVNLTNSPDQTTLVAVSTFYYCCIIVSATVRCRDLGEPGSIGEFYSWVVVGQKSGNSCGIVGKVSVI